MDLLRRTLQWCVVAVVVAAAAFTVGTRVWEWRNCGGPGVTDCDLGVVYGGVVWAGVALSCLAVVIVVAERRRRWPRR